MGKKASKTYDASQHNGVIQSIFDAGLGVANVAAALGITQRGFAKWRQQHPELNEFIYQLETNSIAGLLKDYREKLNKGVVDNTAIRALEIFHNYYVNHVYVFLPELMSAKDVHARHDVLLNAVSNKLLSIEIAERISKLLKDNAEIYNMGEIERKMQAIEAALNAIITKGEL